MTPLPAKLRPVLLALSLPLTLAVFQALGMDASASPSGEAKRWTYPASPKVEQVDDYHGVKVADPYRWLEDLDSPQTKAWVEAQNELTFGYLGEIPQREAIKDRLTKLWSYERHGVVFQRGGRYFFYKNDGLQNQNVWYWAPSLDVEPKILLDPNKLSADGTAALATFAVSENGKFMAYALSSSGSDWREWRIRDVDSGSDLPDLVKWSKFSQASWTHDNKGFFYSRYDEPADATRMTGTNLYQKLYYHAMGTPQSADPLVYERKDHKDWGFLGAVTIDGRYLVISVTEGSDPKNRVFYKDLRTADSKVVELLTDFDASYGYGGFDISMTPAFSVGNLVWMEMGGVFAVANLRGGGEYGEEWHLAGTKLRKQNVFDDFIAAAEWLIANRYTSTPKLAIGGGSNGGLLVGACLNQRPDLFGAALPAVGVMDMLRFDKLTIGWAWASDYGTSDDPEQFKALYAYSPLHNIKPGTRYPASFISTADHDDRVVPAHSFKYAAALQAAQAGPAPILIRIETKAGHGGGKPTTKIIEEKADEWAFLVRELKMSSPPAR